MPAASRAATFSAAVPLPPEMIAPAWPMRLPGGAVRPAMKAATGLVTCSLMYSAAFFLGGAADLADHQDRLPSAGSPWNSRSSVDERGADDRVAAQPDAGRLAQAQVGQLPDGLVGQRAAAADDADGPGLVDVAGHDADLALAGRDDAGAVRPDQPGRRAARPTSMTRTMSSTGMPSVMATISADAGVGRFHDRVGGEGRRHEDHRGVGPGLATASATVSKSGKPSIVWPPRPGVTPPTICVPYSRHCWVWNWPALPVMPWQRTRVFLIDENAHGRCGTASWLPG